MTTGATIRRARERAGLSQRQTAAQLGVSNQTVHRWEHGNRPSVELAPALEQLLGLTPGSTRAATKKAAASEETTA